MSTDIVIGKNLLYDILWSERSGEPILKLQFRFDPNAWVKYSRDSRGTLFTPFESQSNDSGAASNVPYDALILDTEREMIEAWCYNRRKVDYILMKKTY